MNYNRIRVSRFRVSPYRRPLRKAARGLRQASGLNKGLSDPGLQRLREVWLRVLGFRGLSDVYHIGMASQQPPLRKTPSGGGLDGELLVNPVYLWKNQSH